MSRSQRDHVVVVSCDGHAGPLLEDQLRPYCSTKYLRQFDEFVAQHRAREAQQAEVLAEAGATKPASAARPDANDHEWLDAVDQTYVDVNLRTAGHHDVHARLRDMDRDGVAAEVIYNFSTNSEVMPFFEANGVPNSPLDFELGAVGYKMYNRWLADHCSVQPERHIGLAYVPTWDLEATVREVEWACEAGLKGVNFPSVARSYNVPYNHLDWDPFWSACASLGMSLHTHANGAPMADYLAGPGGMHIAMLESGSWLSRRAVWWLIYGQVFERHPRLKLIITEQMEGWWSSTMAALDSLCEFTDGIGLPSPVERLSDYMRTNVYLGCSMMSADQAQDASSEGYADRVLWGRDYPHREGTFLYTDDESTPPLTKLSLRHTFSDVPAGDARRMAGENAVEALGLDEAKLAQVAADIGALTPEDLATPLEVLPEIPRASCAFSGLASERPRRRSQVA